MKTWFERIGRAVALLMLVSVMMTTPTTAQDDDASADDEPATDEITLIRYGERLSGRINADQPRRVYALDALRCDFISIRVTATGGDLDLVVMIVADDGQAIFVQDDSAGSRDVNFSPLSLPRTGRYQVVVGRFGYGLGTTSGTYELLVERVGNGSSPNCAMRYGDTVFYNISDDEPQIIYSFRGRQGDILTVMMQRRSGDLDPYLKIADAFGVVLDFNDDMLGGNTKDAAIEGFVVPADGTYFIFATRYGQQAGTSSGNFSLTLRESQFSGLGNSPMSALAIGYGATIDGTLSDLQPIRYYRFEAQQNQLITISMNRASGNLLPALTLANAGLQDLALSARRSTPDAEIRDYLIPADGTYFIIAARDGRESGTSSGDYQLTLTGGDDVFTDVPADVRRIRYGSSLTGTIDTVTPFVRYAFFGRGGDTVRITMDRSSGDLDPMVSILNASGTILITDDDGGLDRNARIDRFTLPETGIYYIRAGRYDGLGVETTGSFIMVLAQLFD